MLILGFVCCWHSATDAEKTTSTAATARSTARTMLLCREATVNAQLNSIHHDCMLGWHIVPLYSSMHSFTAPELHSLKLANPSVAPEYQEIVKSRFLVGMSRACCTSVPEGLIPLS
jgi:hypothetical protein